jgi:excinuclease ABC subunit A
MSIPKTKNSKQFIEIKGARANNLKNVDVLLPKNKLVVVTGVSGSGKSSLIIDTLYAEGQRRYVESLSAYARQFLNRMKKPDVDYIKGLCPAIAIEQRVTTSNARSTVGSLTEIYDFLRLLFARLGKTYSPETGEEVKKHEIRDVVDFILKQNPQTKVYISFKVQQQYPERSFEKELKILAQKGFVRVFWNNHLQTIDELLQSKSKELKKSVTDPVIQTCAVVVDRILLNQIDEEFKKRIADSILTSFAESHGECLLILNDKDIHLFSSRFELDGILYPEPTPQFFNYNNSFGACPVCEGYGRIIGIDENKVIPDPTKTVYEGAIACWSGEKVSEWLDPLIGIASKINFPLHIPYRKLDKRQVDILWYGKDSFKGIYAFFKELEEKLYKIQNRILLARYRGRTICTDCNGSRLRKEALNVKFAGKSFQDFMFVPVEELLEFFSALKLTEQEFQIGRRLLFEIQNRLDVLQKIGLGYLNLDRLSSTLSGGESQRIHLTRTLGSNLTASLYILDEPSIGLHPKDTSRLVEALCHLRDLGNTVLVIEHEEEVIKKADDILDIGPGAGIHGGKIVFNGSYSDFINQADHNLTASYVTGKSTIPIPLHRKKNTDQIVLEDVNLHNLKDLHVHFPLQSMICVSGVSGSGKTTLIKHVLHPMLQAKLNDEIQDDRHIARISGAIKRLNQVELVSQQGIGRSSRSNPATYIKAYDEIRDIFRQQPLSKLRGYLPKHFSFNVEGGRCENCKGDGEIVVEMQFLADVSLLCEDCNGKRFTNEILEVRYKDKNIFDILEMSVEEAMQFFADKKDIIKKLKPLADVGLSYLKLGQSSSTLSGGEAQRLKLAYYLGLEGNSDHIFFIFDEPTTGLHFDDIKKLLFALHGLVEKGHTVLVIEHNMDVLKTADWIIDLGPGGGKHGGTLMYEGPPEGLLKVKDSHTAAYLKEKLK